MKNCWTASDERKITREELEEGRKCAGRILILSCLDRVGEEIFMMYKQRGHVETQFDSYKNVLHADRMYLQDDESVFGHLFISFLALYGYCKLEKELKKAGLLQRFSPADVLEEFSKVYLFTDGTREVVSEIPRKVAELEAKLGGNVFPK